MNPEQIFALVASALIASAPAVLERDEITPETSLAELGFVDLDDYSDVCLELEDAFPASDLDLSSSSSWSLVSDIVRACTPP